MTTREPTSKNGNAAVAAFVPADKLGVGHVVTNLGVVENVNRVGVFVVAAIRGMVWSLASGKGALETHDVVWHETNEVTIDVPL